MRSDTLTDNYSVKLDPKKSRKKVIKSHAERLKIVEQDLWVRYQAGDLSIVSDWISVITQLRIARNQADKRKGAE
jgi:hypothetical protein